MATKTMGSGALGGGFPASPNANVDFQGSVTDYNTVFNDSSNDLRTQIWSELVTRDAREKNVFSKFIGGEGSGKPIVEKTNLSAGGSDKVTFTTVAPIRGIGVRGEEILKNSTGKLNFGTFNVEVDLMRHAVSWTQVLKLMRFTGKTLDQLSAEVMSEWAARMEQDLLQVCLRDTCLNKQSTNYLNGYGSYGGDLAYSDGLSTDIIQEAKQALIARGGTPMNTGGDQNQEIPGYLFFAPDACLRPLRSDPDYLEAITQADSRGENNKLYSGSYAKWDNNIIANHNIIIDTAEGRQGSPLAPTYYLAADVASGLDWSAAVAGDGSHNFLEGDFRIPGGGGAALTTVGGTADTRYLMIIHSGATVTADRGKVGFYSYTDNESGGWDGLTQYNPTSHSSISAITAGKGISATTVNDTSNQWDAGSEVYQCNAAGTPIGWALAMGENALYLARGAVTNEQIFHYDDFANSGNDAHLSAVGIQSVYGMATYQDTSGRIPGVQLVECVRQIPGLNLTVTT